MQGLWFDHVSTYLNTGNVFFSSEAERSSIVEYIEQGIADTFNLAIRVLLRDYDQIATVCQLLPDDRTNDSEYKTDVIFLRDEITTEQAKNNIQTNPDVDELLFGDGVVIRHLPKAHYNQSKINKFVGTHIYRHMTARNCNTTRKIYQRLEEIKSL